MIWDLPGYKPQTSLCKDESGQIISDQQKVTETRKHYFQTLLGTQLDMEDEMGMNYVEENEVDDGVEASTIEEVLEVIKAQKKNKSPGVDEIPAELYKVSGDS
uniref:Uncharacterized protein LOC114326783 n=1 Tax=Diabrotica virgifera virgifera TaxID=50390 RepID=A0A6P7F6A3_DIAVI